MNNNKKRILLVTPELQYTGALQSFRRICIVLKNNNYVIDVWSYVDGPYIEEFYKIGINVKIVNEDSINKDFIEKEAIKYNLIIANTVCTFKVADLAKDIVPVIWYIREAENLPDFCWKKGREEALKRAYKLYCVSEYAQDFIIKNYNKNVHVVHNFVDDVFKECGYLKKYDKEAKIKFLALGTIEKRKGYDTLINAFLGLPEKFKNRCELHIAGRLWDGAKNFYPQILESINQNENIFYHGEIRDREKIHSLISNCDYVVVPSIDESCSLVALEGAMLGRPLILSQNIGAKYVLAKNCGWTFKTGNINDLTNVFINAINDIDKITDMGKCIRNQYLKTSTYDIYEHNILKMVNDNIKENILYYHLNNIKLFSFDIFDTLITRSVAEPKGIFMIMQQKLIEKEFDKIPFILKSNFVDIRISTERFMYQRICSNEKKDIDIYEIYKLIGLNYELTEEEIKLLIKLELETEEKNILPIKNNIDIVKNLVKNNQRVILISDMYLKEPMIRKLLCNVDSVFENLPLYVSCEFNAKKNTGDLYKKVQAIENICFENWVHYGDNYNGDYKKAIELGIKAKLYNAEGLTDYERTLISSDKGNIKYQKVIGLTKYLRTLNKNSDIKNIGLSFGGPILFPYVNWIVEEANKKGIKNLYFVARDGYILKKIADIIITERNYSIITSYIYGSRVAWRDPVQNKDQEKIITLTEYLKQNIDFTKKFAFAEYAGTGETQDCLVKIMDSIEYDKNNFMGSYYLYHSKNFESQYSKKYSMLRLNNIFSPCIELLVRAPHGQTLGYEYKNGKIEPLLDENEGEALIKYGYIEYIIGVEEYTKEIMNIIKKDICLDIYDYSIIINYMEYLKTSLKDEKLIDFLGGIPFLLNGTTCEICEYAPRLTEKDVNLICLNQTKFIKTNNLKWSEIRSSYTIKKLIGINYKNINSERNEELKLQKELNALRNSRSFKIGRMITFLPRKIKGCIKCYKEHGFKYTFNRLLVHLCLKQKVKKKDYNYYKNISPNKYENELKEWYKNITHQNLNLDNPKTFNEKIQWLKLYDSTPLKTRLADKYLVRKWVEEKIGKEHLIPLLGVWDKFDDIDFNKLPNQFVLKANHSSGWNIIVKNKNTFDREIAKNKFDIWLNKNYAFTSGFELHYMNIPPKIIAEKYIADLDGDIYDYRFFCFNGEPKYIWIDIGSGTSHHRRNIYDLDWNLQNYRVNYPNIFGKIEKPKTLSRMIEYAAKLSKDFAFVRVDFYSVNNHVYFGEMTFTSQSGIGKWEDEKYNLHYGELIKLPSKQSIPKNKILN